MRTTISDIAKKAGLAPGTVSRALSPEGKYYVSETTRKKVTDAAEALGYRPSYLGRALAGGTSGLVCLLAPGPFSSYYTTVARQLAHQSARQGYCLITDCAFDAQTHGGGKMEIPSQDWLYGVDGIVACDTAYWHRDYIAEAQRLKIPMVSISTTPLDGADSVVIDLHSPTRLLIRHMIEQGRRSVAMVVPQGDAGSRGSAYRAEIEAAGLCEQYVHCDEYNRRSGWEAVLQHSGEFDALFCANDELAIGAARALLELGKSIPGDVCIAGCDGIEETEFHNPSITTIVQPLEQICQSAWGLLRRRIDGDESGIKCVNFTATIDYRKSTLSLQK